jgi:hypothetical protein
MPGRGRKRNFVAVKPVVATTNNQDENEGNVSSVEEDHTKMEDLSLEQMFSSAKEGVLAYLNATETKILKLNELEEAEKARQTLCDKNLSKIGKVVSFNLGGKVFKISKTSITKFPFSLFYAILGSGKYPTETGLCLNGC